jgi:hypothetical protein
MPGGSVADLVERFGKLDEAVIVKYTREVLEVDPEPRSPQPKIKMICSILYCIILCYVIYTYHITYNMFVYNVIYLYIIVQYVFVYNCTIYICI